MSKEELVELINSSEMILVGLGEEFEKYDSLNNLDDIKAFNKRLFDEQHSDLFPLFLESLIDNNKDFDSAIGVLLNLLEGKNYYIVSTSINRKILKVNWYNNRVVMPCGTILQKQCPDCCEGSIEKLSEDEVLTFLELAKKNFVNNKIDFPSLGTCKKCNKEMIFNTIYANNYDENGYLTQWGKYMSWVQACMNKKVLILELGTSLKFPSVIRFPFEKLAQINEKANFIRVNEKLWHLPSELSKKGVSISKNSIEWLNNL